MAAVNHPPRPRSTTPCADQPQPRPDPDILVTATGTNLSFASTQFKSEEGTPTFGNAGLSSATPRRGGGDRAGKPVVSSAVRNAGGRFSTPRRSGFASLVLSSTGCQRIGG